MNTQTETQKAAAAIQRANEAHWDTDYKAAVLPADRHLRLRLASKVRSELESEGLSSVKWHVGEYGVAGKYGAKLNEVEPPKPTNPEPEVWRFELGTMTVRDARNHCLFSAKTFGDGGTFDAARLPDAEKILRLAASAPELLKALEWCHQLLTTGISRAGSADAAATAIANAKGRIEAQ